MTGSTPAPGLAKAGRATDRAAVTGAVRWALWSALAVGAFVVAPPLLMPVARGGGLPAAARTALTDFWTSGSRVPPASTQALIDGWRDYHLVKALLALLTLAAFGRLARVLWQRWTSGERPIQRLLALAGGALALGSAFFAALLVLANVQGALAPLASLVSLLPGASVGVSGPVHGPASEVGSADYAQALAGLSAVLSATPMSGGGSIAGPGGAATVADFARFHGVLALMAGVLSVGLLWASVWLWRRRAARRGLAGLVVQRERVTLAVLAGGSGLAALGVLLVAAANVSTALSPAPALLSFIAGLRAG